MTHQDKIVTLEVPQDAALATEFGSEHPCVSAEFAAERTARLLVAGTFPDKDLRLKPEDLDALVERFSPGTVPVKVEHVDSPLDPLGLVQKVWRDGAQLMGTLLFPSDLSGFLQRRGIARLSVGLTRDPLQLSEVSLVLKPRIASAALLSQDAPGPEAEMLRLRRELLLATVNAQIAQLKAQGRVVPACEDAARALLLLADGDANRVTLSEGGEAQSVAAVFRQFLDALPPRLIFAETAPSQDDGQDALYGGASALTPDQEDFLRRVLGVDPAKVRALMGREQEASHARH